MEENEKVVVPTETVGNFTETIKKLMTLNNVHRFNNLRIKNVNLKENEDNDSVRVTFTVVPKIPGYIPVVNPETGETERKLGETNIIYSSNFGIAGMLKEDDEKSWMANTVVNHPQVLNLLMNGGSIDILQHIVPAGEPYHNPFTTRENPEDIVFDNETIINYVIAFKFGKTGERFADKLADKLMGF